jgi:hypothetical protein
MEVNGLLLRLLLLLCCSDYVWFLNCTVAGIYNQSYPGTSQALKVGEMQPGCCWLSCSTNHCPDSSLTLAGLAGHQHKCQHRGLGFSYCACSPCAVPTCSLVLSRSLHTALCSFHACMHACRQFSARSMCCPPSCPHVRHGCAEAGVQLQGDLC